MVNLSSAIVISPHLINIRSNSRVTQRFLRRFEPDIPNLTNSIYEVLPDAFDFFVLFSTNKIENIPFLSRNNFISGVHRKVQTNYSGTGNPLFNNSASFGSNGKLLSVNVIDVGARGISSNNATHEIMHQWSAFIDFPEVKMDSAHYNSRSNAASLVGGFHWNENGDGTFTPDCSQGRGNVMNASPIDRYLMGLIEANEVPTLYAYSQDSLNIIHKCRDEEPIFDDEIVATVTIDDIITRHGVRTPSPADAQRDFAIAFVAESHKRFLNPTEMTFYEILADHYTKTISTEEQTPVLHNNWASMTRFFGERTTWRSDIPIDTVVTKPFLLSHWPLDEGRGIVANDITGNGHDGILTNGPVWKQNKLTFDGIDDFINVGAINVSGEALTLAGWIQSDELGNCDSRDCRILSKTLGTAEQDHNWMLSTISIDNQTRLRFRLKTNGFTSTLIASSGALIDGERFHVAAVYDGAHMRLYKNGIEVGSLAKTGNIDTNNQIDTWIGGNPTTATSRPWKGSIADVRIYQKALTAHEVNNVKDSRTLIARWPLNEGSGFTVNDITGNGHNGILTNDPVWNGNELLFDGIDDFINVGSIDVTGEALTLTGWVNSDDLENCGTGDCRILSKATGTALQDHYWMLSTIKVGNQIRLRFRLKANGSSSTLIASKGDLANGELFHVAATYDGITMHLYKNGVEVGSLAKTGKIDTNNEVKTWIGSNPTIATSRPWKGAIADVRIYKKALSVDEVNEVKDSFTLIAHWPLDEGTGTAANDITGNGHDGVLTNAPIWSGNELLFDGIDDFINVGSIDVTGEALTIAGWVNSDDLENCSARDCRILSKAMGVTGQDHYWMLSTIKVDNQTRLRFRLKTNGFTSTLIASEGDLANGEFFHVAAVYDGANMQLYKDGFKVGSLNKIGSIDTNNTAYVWIGGNPNIAISRPWKGSIADIRIYKKALTEGEVNKIIDDF